MSDSEEKPRRGLRVGIEVKREISFGQMVNASVMVLGCVYAVSVYVGKVDSGRAEIATLTRDVASLRTDMTLSAAAVQAAMAKQFDGVRLDIANLPDVKATMVQLDRRAEQSDHRLGELVKRVEGAERAAFQNNSDINNLTRVVSGMQRSR